MCSTTLSCNKQWLLTVLEADFSVVDLIFHVLFLFYQQFVEKKVKVHQIEDCEKVVI